MGNDIRIAYDGLQGLAMAERCQPDVVLPAGEDVTIAPDFTKGTTAACGYTFGSLARGGAREKRSRLFNRSIKETSCENLPLRPLLAAALLRKRALRPVRPRSRLPSGPGSDWLSRTGWRNAGERGLWRTPIPRAAGRSYKLCANYSAHNVCNWAVPAADPHSLCLSCRLTRVIPDLSKPAHQPAWYELEVAKRRLVYTLAALKLPLLSKAHDTEHGLAFEFLADPEDAAAPRVLTGHAGGVITINLAEADDAERERSVRSCTSRTAPCWDTSVMRSATTTGTV